MCCNVNHPSDWKQACIWIYSSSHAFFSIFKHRYQHVLRDSWHQAGTIPNLFSPENFPLFFHSKIPTENLNWSTDPSSFINPISFSWDQEKGNLFFVWWRCFLNGKKHMVNCLPNVSPPFGDESFGICWFYFYFWKNHLESRKSSFDAFSLRLQDASLCGCKYLHFGQSLIRWCRSWFALGTLRCL